MDVNNCLKKFKILLHEIYEEKCEIKYYYLEKLLKHLGDRTENSCGRQLLETPTFSDLIFHSLERLQHASISSKVFIIEIVTLLFSNELQFSKMQTQGFHLSTLKHCVIKNLQTSIPSPVLHTVCNKLIIVQITHFSGLQPILECKVWETVLCPGLHKKSPTVYTAAYDFITKLIRKLYEYENLTGMYEVLNFIKAPIVSSAYHTIQDFDPDKEHEIADPLLTYLYALIDILKTLDNRHFTKKITNFYTSIFIGEKSIYRVLNASHSPEVVNVVSEFLVRHNFAVAYGMLESNNHAQFYNKIIVSFCNGINTIINKRMISVALDCAVKCSLMWDALKENIKAVEFEMNSQKYSMPNQFLMPILTPILTYVYCTAINDRVLEPFSDYFPDFSKFFPEHVVKLGYSMRALVVQSNDYQNLAIISMRYLLKVGYNMTTSLAATVFQSLYMLLEFYAKIDTAGNLILDVNPFQSPNDVKLLSLILNATKVLLVKFNISWHENMNVCYLQKVLINLLKLNMVPQKQLLQILDLVDFCINNFLSPAMALQLECRQGSSVNELLIMMRNYSHHPDWEVRDSAFTILLSCMEISYVKYIHLQKLICENGLMYLTANAAMRDPDYYPQVTALRCLGVSTKVQSLWEQVLNSNKNIYMELIYLLRFNTEGMVRMEAANVLTQIYANQKLSKNYTKLVYNVMTSVALEDLHWEVQISALRFWKKAIKVQMTNRGMIDGVFPKVTFSKEKRKIITLNEAEVKRELTKMLNDLSEIGCLTVLYNLLQEDFNIEVAEEAYCITRDLVNILESNKFDKAPEDTVKTEDNKHADVEIEEYNENTDMILDLTSTALRDRTIDSILNTNTSDHIINLDKANYFTSVEPMDEDRPLLFSEKEKIQPNLFLDHFRGTDYCAIIEGKQQWKAEPENLELLLDEILALEVKVKFSERFTN